MKPKEKCVCFSVEKNVVSFNDGVIQLTPHYFKSKNVSSLFYLSYDTIKKLNKDYPGFQINHDFKISFKNNEWRLLVPIPITINEKNKNDNSFVGIDLGQKKKKTRIM